jgi:hypothetical protein
MDIGCCDQRDRDDSDKCGTDTHQCPHACHPAASTANDGAVQAAVSDSPKNVGRCPKKNVGQTIPQLCHVSRAREQRAAGCCKNAAIQVHEKQLMKRCVPQFSQA